MEGLGDLVQVGIKGREQTPKAEMAHHPDSRGLWCPCPRTALGELVRTVSGSYGGLQNQNMSSAREEGVTVQIRDRRGSFRVISCKESIEEVIAK